MNHDEARQALGQVFALRFPRSWEGLDLDRFPVANYIIFKDALDTTFEGSRDRIREARARLSSRGIQPLFMMDEEGGRVTQISSFFPSAPSPRAVAKVLRPDEAADLYAQMGAYLCQLGIDINLAPCMDVNTEPLNPIIATRSFGTDASTVTMFGGAALRALRRSVACVPKHFPGHGMTRLDSHRSLPVVNEPREILQAVHMSPFKDAVRWCADGIMVSHCHYRALDACGLPASLSTHVVRGHLRINLRYDGLVFTDSLDMKSVTQNFAPPHAALQAYDASCDVLLYTEMSERFESAFESLLDSLLMGKLSRDHLSKSIARRKKIFDRSTMTADFKPLYDPGIYTPLSEAVRADCVRIEGKTGLLPLDTPGLSVLSTSGDVVQKIRARAPDMVEIGTRREDLACPSGKILMMWLCEPLTVRYTLDALRAMIRAAAKSVLITSYESVARSLAECDITVVTDDLSPLTEDLILDRVLAPSQRNA